MQDAKRVREWGVKGVPEVLVLKDGHLEWRGHPDMLDEGSLLAMLDEPAPED